MMNWTQQAYRLRKDARVSLFAFRHPRVGWPAKLVAVCTSGYLFSPIQLIPSFIPVIGFLDDFLVLLLGALVIRRMVPPDVLAECRRRAEAAEMSRRDERRNRLLRSLRLLQLQRFGSPRRSAPVRWWRPTLHVEEIGGRSLRGLNSAGRSRSAGTAQTSDYPRGDRGIWSECRLYRSSTRSEVFGMAGASGTAGISSGTPSFEGVEGWLVSTGADPCCVCTIQQYCVPRNGYVREGQCIVARGANLRVERPGSRRARACTAGDGRAADDVTAG